MRENFEAKVAHLEQTEMAKWKELLQNAIFVYDQTKKGHSYQSLTGQKPAAAERLMPTIQDLERRKKVQEELDNVSVGTKSTYFN